MRTVVIYESMFGNTRTIAEAIGNGLESAGIVELVRAADADAARLDDADLVVIGAPTHAWGMPRPSTRKGAPNYVTKPGSDLVLEPGATTGPGVREWLSSLGKLPVRAAAFDTRVKGPAFFTGRASKRIGRVLSHHGFTVVLRPESFIVDKKGHLLPGEADRAYAWGAQLGAIVGTPGAARTIEAGTATRGLVSRTSRRVPRR